MTKDIPAMTNILATYEQITAGDEFVLALRTDGTVWATGNNKKGQLADGTTKSRNKLEQIKGLNNIKKIAAGDSYGVAIDDYGIVYEWGRGKLEPVTSEKMGQRIIDIAAGKNEVAYVTAKGTVIGKGQILEGEIEGLNNAIKVEVCRDRIIILTSNGKVYEYIDGKLNEIQTDEYIIDIEGHDGTVMYQTVNETTYLSTGGSILEKANPHGENTYGIGAGHNNTYIIENTGNVYAKGGNKYGSIGDGTREDKEEYTLVGDRNFEIEPITKTMREGDVEEITIIGNPFNVFGEEEISAEEYTWEAHNVEPEGEENPEGQDVVRVEIVDNVSKIYANSEGTAKIDVTDKVTGEKVELTRIVIPQEKDRIARITVNEKDAVLDETSTEDNLKYYVSVVTNEDYGQLLIQTTNKNDIISISKEEKWTEEGEIINDKWSFNGELNQRVELNEKITEFTITVGIKNNEGKYPEATSQTYTLIVEKISDNSEIERITVTSKNAEGIETEIEASPVSLTKYEVVVENDTDISNIFGRTVSDYSYISINGEKYNLKEENTKINLSEDGKTEVRISVKTEAGNEKEFTLIIYKEEAALELMSLTVNDEEAKKLSDTEYQIVISRELETANIKGILSCELAEISFDDGAFAKRTNTKSMEITQDETTVVIHTKIELNGKEYDKDYTLTIIRKSNNTNLLEVKVDGEEAELKEDGKYYYKLSEVKEKVNVYAKVEEQRDTSALVQIEENEKSLHETNSEIGIITHITEVKIKVEAEDGTIKEHVLVIEGLPDDVNIDKVIVNEIEAKYNYSKGRYEVRCKEEEFDVHVILSDKLATLELGGNAKKQGEDRITVSKTGEETIVKVKVTSQSELVTEEYEIAILPQSNNSKLDWITVNDKTAELREDGKYHVNLVNATEEFEIIAQAEDTYAITKIEENENSSYVAKLKEIITDREIRKYIYEIKIEAENGDISLYELEVEILEANYELEKVLVGEEEIDLREAEKQEDGSYYYKIRNVEEGYVSAIPVSSKSTVKINGDSRNIVNVSLPNEITRIKITVIGEDESEKEIALIIEKQSSNTEIKSVTGEGVLGTEIKGNIVYVDVDEDLNEVNLTITLVHNLASLKLEADSEYKIHEMTTKVDLSNYPVEAGVMVNLDVKAEDGTTEQYIINLVKKANLNLESVTVNNETIEYNTESEKYETLVGNGIRPPIVAVAENKNQKVQILNSSGTVLVAGTGTATYTPTLSTSSLSDKYIIRVTSHVNADLGTKDYELVINQKSTETGITYVKVDNLGTYVNGTVYSATVAGKEDYPVEIKLKDEKAMVKITDTAGQVLIDNQNGVLTGSLNVPNDMNNYKMIVTAENGNTKEYTLQIERISSNIEIESITVTDVDEEKLVETYDNETKTYIVYVSNKLNTTNVKVKTVSNNATILLDSSTSAKGTASCTKALPGIGEEIVTIKVTAADGTTETKYLKIVQLPSETGIEFVKVDDIESEKNYKTYSSIVRGKDNYPVEIKLIDEKAKVSIESTTGDILIPQKVGNLTGSLNIPDGEIKEFIIVVTAQDGTEERFTLSIECITANTDIERITVTDISGEKLVTEYDEQTKTYTVIVTKDLPETIVNVTTKETESMVSLDEKEQEKQTSQITKTLPGVGIETVEIVVTAPDGLAVETRYLKIRQLSDETGIEYIHVDNKLTNVDENGITYSIVVSGKEKYPVDILLTDEKAKVRIEDLAGNVLIADMKSNLSGELEVADGKKVKFIVVVTAEDGTEKEYMLNIERISSKLDIESITVRDIAEDGTYNTKQVQIYDENTKTYKVTINKDLEKTRIVITAESTKTLIEANDELSSDGVLVTTKILDGIVGTTRKTTMEINVTAQDGSTETRYLEIVQLSNDVELKEVYVDSILIKPNEVGDYEATVTDEVDLAHVKAILQDETSKVEINGANENLGETENDVSKGRNRYVNVPIKVTAADGTEYTYKLTLKVISTDTSVQEVKVDGEQSKLIDGVYIAYFDKYANEVTIDIIAGVKYSVVSHEKEDGSEISGVGTLTFKLDTSDKTKNEFETTFKITAEDGQHSKEYNIKCIRKSDDMTIKEVFVDDIELEENTIETGYPVGTYYTTTLLDTAKVRVKANSEFAEVRFNGASGIKELEQTVTLDSASKITEVPVTIVSQQGNTYETVIYIEKVTNNCELLSVKVDKKAAQITEIANTYLAYVYDTANEAKVRIEAKDENATVVRTDKSGDVWLDENGLSRKGKKVLEMTVPTKDEEKTTIYFKVIAENGEESVNYILELEDMSIDTSLEAIYVDGILIEKNEQGRYETSVLDTKEKVQVKAVTNNEKAYVRISLGDERQHISEEEVALSAGKQTKVQITVRSQSGITKFTYLYINVISTNIKLAQVQLDSKNADYYTEATHTYTFIVDNTKTDYELFVLAESDYTILEFEEIEYTASFTEMVNVPKEVEGKSFKVKAIAEAGGEMEYIIDVIHSSDNTNLEFLKVNDVEVYPDEPGGTHYTVTIPKDAISTLIEVQTEHKYANLRLGDNTVAKHYDKGTLDCSNMNITQIVVPIVVTAADGKTTRTYNVTLIRDRATYLMGKILTENVEGEYISEITVYKLVQNEEGEIERIEVTDKKTKTEKDGTYKIKMYEPSTDTEDILTAKYEIVVKKAGYLNYTVTEIELEEDKEIKLGEYKLIAGDTVETNKIDIEDLVSINNHIGINVTYEEGVEDVNAKYDLNEDGVIDKLDRNILRSNYGKNGETVTFQELRETKEENAK